VFFSGIPDTAPKSQLITPCIGAIRFWRRKRAFGECIAA
jgi:hypothetical protein